GAVSRLTAFAFAAALLSAAPLTAATPQGGVVDEPEIALSGEDLAFLNRITWGANASSARLLARLGRPAFLDQPLPPPRRDRLPAEVEAQIDALSISQTPAAELAFNLERQRREANAIADPEQKREARRAYRQTLAQVRREAATRSLLRDLYSPDQLKEQLTWF